MSQARLERSHARLEQAHRGGAGRDIVSIGPLNALLAAGRGSRRLSSDRRRPGSGWMATHRLAGLVLALVTSLLVAATPALGAEGSGTVTSVRDETKDAD